jgi:hypothetical protein
LGGSVLVCREGETAEAPPAPVSCACVAVIVIGGDLEIAAVIVEVLETMVDVVVVDVVVDVCGGRREKK